jgi:hypothetical protein
MMILIIDQFDIRADEAECHPPIAVDPDRPESAQLTLQRMQLIAGLRTAAFFTGRAGKGDREAFRRLLTRAGGEAPGPRDEAP